MSIRPTDESKRNFLKSLAWVSAIVAVAGFAPVLKYTISPSAGIKSFPTLKIVDASGNALKASAIPPNSLVIMLFEYPLQNEPNFLLNMDKSVKGGVGPGNQIVAFSAICEHLGCIPPSIRYYPPGMTIPGTSFGGPTNPGYIHCMCHGSTFDPANGARIITGPTIYPQPQVTLIYDSTDDSISAAGMTGPVIYSHTSDLTGGNAITGTSTAVITESS